MKKLLLILLPLLVSCTDRERTWKVCVDTGSGRPNDTILVHGDHIDGWGYHSVRVFTHRHELMPHPDIMINDVKWIIEVIDESRN